MTNGPMGSVIQHLRRAILLRDGAGLTDGQLLTDYISHRDDAAVAALVHRHGPMVWGVCRRVLRNDHDAEDAFQTTFLVLVRKAESIASRELVANWLYGVAHKTALKARATAARRKERETQVTAMPEPAGVEQELWRDLQPVLDEALNRLPDKYRAVIVLCDLEGKSRKEAARQLGCPLGTVGGRLARARAMLAKRFAQRGIALSAGALAAELAQNVASACVPSPVVSPTMRAASLFAVGRAVAAGAITVKVGTLTEGMLKPMLLIKLKTVLAIVLVVGFVATGASILARHTAATQGDEPPTAEKRVNTPKKQDQEKNKVPFTAWGKEVNGLQAGLGFCPGEQGVRHDWGMVTLVVRVRSVSMKEVTFEYCPESDWTQLPDVTDANGKPIAIKGGFLPLNKSTKKVNLAPGDSIELWHWKLNLRPESESTKAPPDNPPYATLDGPGKFIIQYPWVTAWKLELKPPNTWAKLGTGKLEIEVKSDPPQKQEKKQQEEAFTAWGKEINGLQAGLGFRPGEHRAYHHGETATLVVRVRNVGKETVKFQYLNGVFFDKPPTVTDGEGKPIASASLSRGGTHSPLDVSLAPGKEIELYEWKPVIKPPSEKGTSIGPGWLSATGKLGVQYERVLENSSVGSIKIDPGLSKLGTGKLELEIKSDPPRATNKNAKAIPNP